VEYLIDNFLPDHKFDPVRSCILELISRSSLAPSPLLNPILPQFSTFRSNGCVYTKVVRLIENFDPKHILMVGDGMHDIQSGNAAGALTCLLKHQWNLDARNEADFIIDNLMDVERIVREHDQ
jgi:phosphoglycolate phosphatase-like HAD superfamily hydrolase